jgi:hypothetical protein
MTVQLIAVLNTMHISADALKMRCPLTYHCTTTLSVPSVITPRLSPLKRRGRGLSFRMTPVSGLLSSSASRFQRTSREVLQTEAGDAVVLSRDAVILSGGMQY